MFAKNITTRENVLILGLGGMGFYLAKRLLHEGYSVTAIESDLAFIQYADCNIDARLIAGDAMSIHCWQEADAENMDILIAVTDNDAVNMMAASIGHQFGIKKKLPAFDRLITVILTLSSLLNSLNLTCSFTLKN